MHGNYYRCASESESLNPFSSIFISYRRSWRGCYPGWVFWTTSVPSSVPRLGVWNFWCTGGGVSPVWVPGTLLCLYV